MSAEPTYQALTRPSFFDGQQLQAADLGALGERHRLDRWLHNRIFHDWGVAEGLEVTGQRGTSIVTVSAGMALDCVGRELINPEAVELSIPPVVGARTGGSAMYFLVMTYLEDEDLPAIERAGVCNAEGAVRRAEYGRIHWKDPTDTNPDTRFRRGEDIVLATAHVANCKLAEPISLAERLDVSASPLPHVAAGSGPAGSSEWRYFPQGADPTGEQAPLGVSTIVSTVGAGFSNTPVYTAQLRGGRSLPTSQTGLDGDVVIDGIPFVSAAESGRFEATILLPAGVSGAFAVGGDLPLNPVEAVRLPAFLELLGEYLDWHISWMGVVGQ